MAVPFDPEKFAQSVSRRAFLKQSAYGLGGLALGTLLDSAAHAVPPTGGSPGAVQPLNFPPRAKRIIHLCMAGGPSQVESFDNKPVLRQQDGQPFPASLTQGQQLAQLQGAT